MEHLDFEKTEMEHLNFLEFLEEKVLRKSLLSIRSVISIKVCGGSKFWNTSIQIPNDGPAVSSEKLRST